VEPPRLFLELASQPNCAIGRRAMVSEVTKKSSFTAPLWRWEELPEGQPSLQHQSGLYVRVARQKPLLSKRHMTAHLEYSKRHLEDCQTMRNKIL
jgi:hypothetical protein